MTNLDIEKVFETVRDEGFIYKLMLYDTPLT